MELFVLGEAVGAAALVEAQGEEDVSRQSRVGQWLKDPSGKREGGRDEHKMAFRGMKIKSALSSDGSFNYEDEKVLRIVVPSLFGCIALGTSQV